MKKLKLFLKLNLFLLILTFFTSTKVIKAHAGEANAQGSTPESTGYSGNNFNPQSQRVNTQLTNVTNSIQINNGQITLPQDIQQRVNQVASNILNEIDYFITTELNDDRDKTTISTDSSGSDIFDINSNEFYSADIISIFTEETSFNAVSLPIQDIFVEAGVNSELAETLINSIQGMISFPMSVSDIDTYDEIFPTTQILANNKSLNPYILSAQNKQIHVDINKLNTAINAFNKIIMKSDTETLNQLARNQNFMTIRNLLNRFRIALSKPVQSN